MLFWWTALVSPNVALPIACLKPPSTTVNWRIQLEYSNTCTNQTGYWVNIDNNPCQLVGLLSIPIIVPTLFLTNLSLSASTLTAQYL